MISDQRSVLERYLSATRSTNLTLRRNSLGDADQLIAAGMACTAPGLSIEDKDRRMMAIEALRLQGSGCWRGAGHLLDRMSHLILRRSMRERPGKCRTMRAMSLSDAREIALTVLRWRHHKACPTCFGRGHPTIGDGREVLDETRVCGDCHGTGEIRLERLVRREHASLATWISGEIDVVVGRVEFDMHRLLRQAQA